MYKKISIPLILALVTTLAFSGVAYAAPETTTASSTTRSIGTVISVDFATNSFKLMANTGGRPTIHVDSSTVFRGLISSFAALKASDYVNVQTKLDHGERVATVVNVLRPKVTGHIAGSVTALHSSSFEVLGSNGVTYTFDVTANTTFSGQGVIDFDGLALGMKVKVAYTDLGNGVLRATNVIVTQISLTVSGTVTSKDSSTFTILGTDGITSYTFQVTTKTVFSGLDVTKFGQLKVGYRVKVGYAVLSGGTLRAVNVIIRHK